MNSYEAKQEARKARYAAMAEKMRERARVAHSRAHSMAECIPFGQPILVGHHSEGRDRRFRQRIHDTFGKSFALMEKAEHYERKAAGVGGNAISSDDPEAIAKLKRKLESLEKAQVMMKQINAVIRKHKNSSDEAKTAALVAQGFSEGLAQEIIKPDFAGRVGFPSYRLTNNNSEITRTKARIAELEAKAQKGDAEQEYNGFTYRRDSAENRLMLIFPGKPSDDRRRVLKKNGFKWSPSRGAWVRLWTRAAENWMPYIIKDLESID